MSLQGLRPANERRRYFVTTSLIGWTQAWNHPCMGFLVALQLYVELWRCGDSCGRMDPRAGPRGQCKPGQFQLDPDTIPGCWQWYPMVRLTPHSAGQQFALGHQLHSFSWRYSYFYVIPISVYLLLYIYVVFENKKNIPDWYRPLFTKRDIGLKLFYQREIWHVSLTITPVPKKQSQGIYVDKSHRSTIKLFTYSILPIRFFLNELHVYYCSVGNWLPRLLDQPRDSDLHSPSLCMWSAATPQSCMCCQNANRQYHVSAQK